LTPLGTRCANGQQWCREYGSTRETWDSGQQTSFIYKEINGQCVRQAVKRNDDYESCRCVPEGSCPVRSIVDDQDMFIERVNSEVDSAPPQTSLDEEFASSSDIIVSYDQPYSYPSERAAEIDEFDQEMFREIPRDVSVPEPVSRRRSPRRRNFARSGRCTNCGGRPSMRRCQYGFVSLL